ncbi:MAG: LysR family transcriptional regulator [Pseudomonadota bacterium]
MEFRQIRYALAVARERSFTRASARLSISQSAISEQVRLLEQQLKFPLFRRTGRGVELTQRGRAFLHEAERVMTDLLNLDDTARRLRGAAGDLFMLGTASGMAQRFMPRLFRQFQRITPEIRLEIVTASTKNIFRELQEQRLDAGIALDSEPDRIPAGIIAHRLAEAELVIIAHPEHRITQLPPPIDIGRLISEPIIMSELTTGHGAAVMMLFADLGTRPDILAIADDIETVKAIVQSGTGIAIVPPRSSDQ